MATQAQEYAKTELDGDAATVKPMTGWTPVKAWLKERDHFKRVSDARYTWGEIVTDELEAAITAAVGNAVTLSGLTVANTTDTEEKVLTRSRPKVTGRDTYYADTAKALVTYLFDGSSPAGTLEDSKKEAPTQSIAHTPRVLARTGSTGQTSSLVSSR
jgi:hypothetical protein